MSNQLTFIEKVVGAGFSEVDTKGKSVKGSDYSKGFYSLDFDIKPSMNFVKANKRIFFKLIPNGGSIINTITLLKGEQEFLYTETGAVSQEALDKFLG